MVTRSSVSRVNEQQSPALFEEVFGRLLECCQARAPDHLFRLKGKIYSVDASIIDLTLALYLWACYQARKGAAKLHVALDHGGYLPAFVDLSEEKRQEIRWV